jgi:dihydroorotate dehydrogenase
MPWRSIGYRAVRPLLFRFDSERIHRLTVSALRIAGQNGLGRSVASFAAGASHAPTTEVAGLRFRSRIGVGAGFDKDGVALRGWAALGFGFAEVGTVTPLPQAGSARPRLFRLPDDEALINRMGFNNAGAATVARNVMLARRHLPAGFVVGLNIGRNAATADEASVDDYLAAQRLLGPVADYLAVNVSSPNTPGLRDLQAPSRLRELLPALVDAGERLGCPRPIFVKLAPTWAPATWKRSSPPCSTPPPAASSSRTPRSRATG